MLTKLWHLVHQWWERAIFLKAGFLLHLEEAINLSLRDLRYSGICGKYISRITSGEMKTASLYLLTLAHNTRRMSADGCLCLISHGDYVDGLYLFLVLSGL